MRLALALLAALAAAAPAAPAAADVVPGVPTPETEVAGVVGRWDRARAQSDVAVLAEVMAADFAATWAEGARLTRADILAGRAPERGARLIYRDDIEIRVEGDRAVATSRVTRIGTGAGPETGETSREILTLRREGRLWRLVAARSDPDRRD